MRWAWRSSACSTTCSPARPRGWRGHGAAVLRRRPQHGRAEGGRLARVRALRAGRGFGLSNGRYLLGVVVLVLATNLFNLLDLRPGRSFKAFVLLGAGLTLGTLDAHPLAALGLFVGPVLVVGIYDLRERAMLGDTGSNLIGALAGLWIVLSLRRHRAGDRAGGDPRRDDLWGVSVDFRARRADSAAAAARLARQTRMSTSTDASPQTRFIFVTGGVVSALGKGIAAASIGRLLVARGLRVQLQKFDPYINVDPGTMSPYQHGEVFVTEDGAETDLDLGHYERFTDANTTRASNVTAGAVYNTVIRRERRGDYLGGDRPGRPPHHRRDQAARPADRRVLRRRRRDHRDRRDGRRHRVAAVPGGDPPVPGRRRARGAACSSTSRWSPTSATRASSRPSPPSTRSTSCGASASRPTWSCAARRSALAATSGARSRCSRRLPVEAIVSARDVDNIYKVPLVFRDEGVDDFVLDHFGIEAPPPDLSRRGGH